MDIFSLDPRARRVRFLLSRSPLVRRSDRLEVLVMDCLRVGRENDFQGRRFVAPLDVMGPG